MDQSSLSPSAGPPLQPSAMNNQDGRQIIQQSQHDQDEEIEDRTNERIQIDANNPQLNQIDDLQPNNQENNEAIDSSAVPVTDEFGSLQFTRYQRCKRDKKLFWIAYDFFFNGDDEIPEFKREAMMAVFRYADYLFRQLARDDHEN